MLDHVLRWTDEAWIISREIEIARVGPEAKTRLIHRHQPTGAIDDGSTLTQGIPGLGLEASSTSLQITGLHQLQPGHSTHQTDQPGTQDQKNDP